MSGPSFEDRLRGAFDAEAAELERRRLGRGAEPKSADAEIVAVIHELPDPEPVPASPMRRTRWVLPAAAAAAMIALIAWLGTGPFDSTNEDLVAPSPSTLEAPTDEAVPESSEAPTLSSDSPNESPPPTAPPSTVSPTAAALAPADDGATSRSPGAVPVPGEPLVYIVVEGDTLGQIAERYNVTLAAILAANPTLDADLLLLGTELLIPPPDPGSLPPVLIPPADPPPVTPDVPSPVPTEVVVPIAGDVEYCVTGIFSPDVLNVRTGPGTEFVVEYELEQGECGIRLAPVDPVRGWRRISVAGRTGWVASAFIEIRDPGPGVVCVEGLADGETLNVRAGPGVEFEILGELLEGECLDARGAEVDGWLLLDNGGLVGWSSARFLDTAGSSNELQLAFVMLRLNPITADAAFPALTSFEIVDASTGAFVSERYLAPDGSFVVPLDLLPRTIRVTAPLPGDPLCWWSGQVDITRTSVEQVHDVDVGLLCA